ncbi:response regulator [Maribacter cobaltidurans]|uniref:Uncharacterized protein n=1 Tax=Maribacter cobaltidurans TaxID=1178778 RepID=A0A223VAI5_9FLAO|nr:response regulator [Maribacter cobaltidurans]ASV32170.1 hypothetical protein CJ263_19160 [Maribacter cobaltidurans]GGD91210.1 response regulator [Maribacter cobaltidurans]
MNSKVLLIEDDETTNFIHKIALRKEGLEEVHEVLNGLDAFHFLEKDCPDLIFLDINMPIMDGWEFLQEKESRSLCQGAKIAMLTSSNRNEDRERAESYPSVIAYLEKPLTSEKIKVIQQKLAS